MNPIWLVDRSRIQAFRDCPRLRYLTYHFAGKGLERTTFSLPLINGDFVHIALSRLITGEDLDKVLYELTEKYRLAVAARGISGQPTDDAFLVNEQLCLLEGLIRAWARVRLPAILAEFDVLEVEREHQYEIAPGIIVMVRLDVALRRKRDQRLFVKDYKTVSAIYDSDWGKKFEHDSQLLCYGLAAEHIYQEPLGGFLMEGIVKGKRSKDRSNTSPFRDTVIQQSDLCYGYRSYTPEGFPLFERKWSRGAEKYPVWEMPGGVEAWLATEWSDLDCNELFVTPPAIRPMGRDLDRWKKQASNQEADVQAFVGAANMAYHEMANAINEEEAEEAWDAYQDLLDIHFPQNHAHCFRYFGYPCAMERLCFTEEVERDPLGSTFYQERRPHHTTEEEQA